MRPITLHFRGGEIIQEFTIVRGGILRHISHCMNMDGIGTVVGYGFLRLRNQLFDLQSPTVVPGTYDDILSACPWIQAGAGHVYHRNVDFRIDDRQKLYVSYDNCGGTPANIEQLITLWIEDFPPGGESERDERLAEGRRRLPPRAVSLAAARALLAESEGRFEVPKKPSH